MISRPTTDQVLRDCARELLEQVLPSVGDDAGRVRVHMLATVLENAAVRSGHEIAWMRAEAEQARTYAAAVLAATGDPDLRAALAIAQPPVSYVLADVAMAYSQAGSALGLALALAQSAGPADLLARGEELLRERLAHERRVMATYQVVGR